MNFSAACVAQNFRRLVLSALLPVLSGGCEPLVTNEVAPTLAPPQADAPPVDPPIQCQEQHGPAGTPIVVHGSGFAPIVVDIPRDPQLVLPDLRLRGAHDLFGTEAKIGDVVFSGVEGGDNVDRLSWQSATQMTFIVNDALDVEGATAPIPPGLYDVEVKNADGQAATSLLAFAVTARPGVASLAPALTCLEQGPRTLILSADNALRIGAAGPVVKVGGLDLVPTLTDCQAVAHPGLDAELCTTLRVDLLQDALPPGAHGVSIHNPAPAACGSTDVVDLAVVPAPVITVIEPPTVCAAEAGVLDLTVRGSGFLRVDATDFALTVNGALVVPSSITDCTPVEVKGLRVQTCHTFVVSVDAATFPVGTVELVLTNPAPADCTATTNTLFEVLPSPRLDAVAPPDACARDGGVDLAVTGAGFLQNGVENFRVTVGGVVVVPTSIAGCTPITVQGAALTTCSSFVVNVDPAALPLGTAALAVTNPAPDNCQATRSDLFEVLPSPSITAVAPEAICSIGAGVLDLSVVGTDFLRAAETDFVVEVAGVVVVPTSISGCTAITVAGQNVQSCTGFVVNIDAGALNVGSVALRVTNPAPDGCLSAISTAFEILPPPSITAVVPDKVCSDSATSVTVTGTSFGNGTTLTFDGAAPDTLTLNADLSLTATFASGLPAGDYDVTVSNGAGCESTLANGLSVDPTPLVFFVDPPVIFNGVTFEATLFLSGIDQTAAAVDLVDVNGTATAITSFASPDRPQRILATIEAGLDPGAYEVRVTSVDGCVSSLDGRLSITDQTTLVIDSVDPGFVSPTAPTALTIVGSGAVAFANLPRVYLNPLAGGKAISVRAVELNGGTQLSAVVSGAAPGNYQLIVVNPGGEVGIAADPVIVTELEPPLVTSVAPAALDAGSISTVVVTGSNFSTDAAPTLTLECQNFASGANVTAGSATVTTASATSLSVSVNASVIAAGTVCVVVVKNADNATFRFSALSFKNPAQNLNDFRAGSSMVQARRGLVLAAGRPTDTSRFLYAVGGDNGDVTTAKTSVEAVPVDPFGVMGAWSLQRNDLSNAFDGTQVTSLPRTLAGVARIGRFVYIVGGDNGAGAVNTVLRAQILDPLAGPEVLDLDAALGDGVAGLPEGLFLYRVSALFPNTDSSNPGGESLAGELFNVQVPAVADRLLLTLTWAPVAGASGYRIYRSPGPDLTAADLQLLAVVNDGATLTFLDDDSLSTDLTQTPQPAGSLGVWHALTDSPLSIPRAAQATVSVAASTAGQFFLYAVGGRTTGGTVEGSGELSTITVAADGSQTMSAFRPLTATLNPPRQEVVGLSIADSDTPLAADNTFLFFLCGRVANGNDDNTVQGAAIDANGDIAAFTVLSDPNPPRVGAAGLSANGFLYLFGGQNGLASNSDLSTSLVNASPTLDNFNSLGGGSMLVPRVSLSAAQESAFFFVGGGANTVGVAVSSIDQTVQ